MFFGAVEARGSELADRAGRHGLGGSVVKLC